MIINDTKISVYKYRGDKNKFERDLESLEKNYFYAPNAKKLNDPCETLVFTDSFKNQTSFLIRILGVESKCNLNSINGILDDFLKKKNDFGIYSLSRVFNDELLWAHYACNHKGFCIEYDLSILLNSGSKYDFHCFPVKYSNIPPQIDINDIQNIEIKDFLRKIAGTKSKRWRYEEEIRIITDKFGEQSYDFRAVKSIYFGLRMENKHKEEIMRRLCGRNIKYYQICLEERSYKFHRKKIKDKYKDSQKYFGEFYRAKSSENLPAIVKYEIVEQKNQLIFGKGDLSIRLESKLTKSELTSLGVELKDKLYRNAERVYINYYLPDSSLDVAWAITHFIKDKKTFQILGFSISQEKEFINIMKKEHRKIIGQWLDESPYVGRIMTLLQDDGKVYLEEIYKDKSKSLEEQISKKVSDGIRYENKKPNGSGEYLIITTNGTLKYYDQEGLLVQIKKKVYRSI